MRQFTIVIQQTTLQKALQSPDHYARIKVQVVFPTHKEAKVSSQQLHASPCGRKWFDCAECHAEQEKHPLLQSFELIFACKKCKKCFRKDTKEFEESDEYCPHCDNHFVIDAKTPKAALSIESEDVRVNNKMLRDERVKQQGFRTMFDPDEDADKLG
ncbi:hypothetical protein E4U33_005805 [Claviceps sp. LM78 group G4]|nr:hypothetical protein E4U33_005805 [Claviceps sp. LM78 group G4]